MRASFYCILSATVISRVSFVVSQVWMGSDSEGLTVPGIARQDEIKMLFQDFQSLQNCDSHTAINSKQVSSRTPPVKCLKNHEIIPFSAYDSLCLGLTGPVPWPPQSSCNSFASCSIKFPLWIWEVKIAPQFVGNERSLPKHPKLPQYHDVISKKMAATTIRTCSFNQHTTPTQEFHTWRFWFASQTFLC